MTGPGFRLSLPSPAEAAARLREAPWALWRRQVRAVVALEVRKMITGRRAALPAFLALAPVLLFSLRAAAISLLQKSPSGNAPMTDTEFAVFFQTAELRLIVFFGCVAAFTALFRGESQERTLHYYLLSPVRRDLLVVGKYIAGLAVSAALFCLSVASCYLLIFLPFGRAVLWEHFQTVGLRHLAAYLLVTVLACLGYGAVFLALGLLQKNAVVTSVGVLAWESFNFLMPPLVKKVSVVHYLQSLCPVPVDEGPLALIAQPTPPRFAIPCLLVVSVAFLCLAAWRLRRVEILYTGE